MGPRITGLGHNQCEKYVKNICTSMVSLWSNVLLGLFELGIGGAGAVEGTAVEESNSRRRKEESPLLLLSSCNSTNSVRID